MKTFVPWEIQLGIFLAVHYVETENENYIQNSSKCRDQNFSIKSIQHNSKLQGPNEKEKSIHSSIHPSFLPSFLPSLRSLKVFKDKGRNKGKTQRIQFPFPSPSPQCTLPPPLPSPPLLRPPLSSGRENQ